MTERLKKEIELYGNFPVHETIKVLDARTASKSRTRWVATLFIQYPNGFKEIAIYAWRKFRKKGDTTPFEDIPWKQKGKIAIRKVATWENIEEGVESMLSNIAVKT